jgi:Txe/YoeB family toxin of Txe-Axe toxin-antitoxin module
VYGVPLFNEDLVKWTYDPICRELFNVHRGYFSISGINIPRELCLHEKYSNGEAGIVELVIQHYGHLDGNDLSAISHREDSWNNTPDNDVIPKDLIRDFYFAQWESDNGLDNDVIVTREEIEHQIELAKNSPIYDTVDEAFREVLAMKLRLKLIPNFLSDLKRLRRKHPELLTKVRSLPDEVLISPFTGRGHPHAYTRIDMYWAREITHKYRYVYKVDNGIVELLSCCGHYDGH